MRQNTPYSNAFVNRHFSVDIFGTASHFRGPFGLGVSLGCLLLIPSSLQSLRTVLPWLALLFAAPHFNSISPARKSMVARGSCRNTRSQVARRSHPWSFVCTNGERGQNILVLEGWRGLKETNLISTRLRRGGQRAPDRRRLCLHLLWEVHRCLSSGWLLGGLSLLLVFPGCGGRMKLMTNDEFIPRAERGHEKLADE